MTDCPHAHSGGRDSWLRKPLRQTKQAPCQLGCPNCGDIRQWVGMVSQHEKMGITRQEAYARAWRILVDVNPFPATMGRVCPHPCEQHCNRADKDGAVEINALERFLGDWALAEKLPLERQPDSACSESIGVIGAGPAGLSFAYQMVRRGYAVTVYERAESAGGMLRFGIPAYRLPKDVLEAEIQRIVDLGVDLRLNCAVGPEHSPAALRQKHDIVFVATGAPRGLALDLPGAAEPTVITGTDFLAQHNRGEAVELGKRVIVVGGGNTAIDAARAARRHGCEVTIAYRRSREQMPAIALEVDEAFDEGVRFEFLSAPLGLHEEQGALVGLRLQRMQLGEPDASGRQRPVPIDGATFELPVDTIIAAISQVPDPPAGFDELPAGEPWLHPDETGKLSARLWAGGDVRGLGLAVIAIAQGRFAAESVHAELRGLPAPVREHEPAISAADLNLGAYSERAPAPLPHAASTVWQQEPDAELAHTLDETAFEQEASRCLSCGQCFGCELCFMYCNPAGYVRVEEVEPGCYFTLAQDACEGCGKCIDLCPCGYIGPRPDA
jgi:NADPH-dependent glutamate synthase beta subunit-like oxidoreductase/Pyruvate/2-oxoacid:ferredoxin oxidoreductase delta subunit